jgi:hypothetical protein
MFSRPIPKRRSGFTRSSRLRFGENEVFLPKVELNTLEAITAPVDALFDSLGQSIDATNAGLLLPTSGELFEPMPKVRVVDKPMFPEKK